MAEMRTITYKDAVREAMCEEMRRDKSVFLMGEDIGKYCGAFGVSKGMLDEFGPERIIETPISETAFMGAGVGAASALILFLPNLIIFIVLQAQVMDTMSRSGIK